MWSIRSISDVCVGIHWIGSGAVGKAASMLVREVSNRPEMVILGSLVDYLQRTVKRLTRDTVNTLTGTWAGGA